MAKKFPDTLQAYAAELSKQRLSYKRIIELDCELKVPADVTGAQLENLYCVCFRILGIGDPEFPVQMRNDMDAWQADHLAACASDQIERTLFDTDGANRAHTDQQKKDFEAAGEKIPRWLAECDLPPALNIPWDADTAHNQLGPYLRRIECELSDNPAANFRLCWSVLHDRYREGYPVFREVISKWMESLEARGIGMPGTVDAFGRANDLDTRMETGKTMTWTACKYDILPLLEHDHPILAASAARYLGEFYANGAFEGTREAPPLTDILELLRFVKGYREAVCGGFVCGYDDGACEGLSVLTTDDDVIDKKYDVDQWVIDALGHDKPAPDLPNTQSLWFYIHEHYCCAPQMPMRLIDMGRSWVALMCATELSEPVEGMKPVLERLAQDDDEDISGPAKQHLSQYYST